MNRPAPFDACGESPRRQPGTTPKWLRRLALTLLVAVFGLAIGVWVTPGLRRAYHIRRLSSPDPAIRINAMNILAGISLSDHRAAGPLVDALLRESPDSAGRSAVGTIASWSLQRSAAVRKGCIDALDAADDSQFATVADWLREAGYWRHPPVEVEQLVRRERLRASDAGGRLAALANLAMLGPPAGPYAEPILNDLRGDTQADVRAAVVLTSAACLSPDMAVDRFALPALQDTDLSVCRQAFRVLGVVDRDRLSDMMLAGANRFEWQSHEASLWALAGTTAGNRWAVHASQSGDAEMVQRAAWLLGFGGGKANDDLVQLTELLNSPDGVVVQRAAIALTRGGFELADTSRLVSLLGHVDGGVRVAVAYALGRVGPQKEAVAALRPQLAGAIQTGEVNLAAACAESLGLRGDAAYLQVLLDMVDEFPEQPVLGYVAARSAALIDEASAVKAMLELCASPVDEVREMAAFALGAFREPPVDVLVEGVMHGGDPFRGGAALALALSSHCSLASGESLSSVLARRFKPRTRQFEPVWAVRSNYLSARVACGDSSAEGDLEVYQLNVNVSPVGPMLALLHAGRIDPLDLLLADSPSIDVDSLLGDARFADVVRRYLPQAPLPIWAEDRQARAYSIDHLRAWWQVFRLRLRFDKSALVFRSE